MSNPNPLSPQGSLLEQQARNKSSLRIAALIVAAHVCVLGGFLILGCKKEEKGAGIGATEPGTGAAPTGGDLATNPPPVTDNFASNTLPSMVPPVSNAIVQPPVQNNPIATAPPVVPATQPAAEAAPGVASDYKVKPGDFLAKIAKAHGVSLKALLAANPGVNPKKLKAGQTIHIPEGGKSGGSSPAAIGAPGGAGNMAPAASHADAAAPESGEVTTYQVKGGDTLARIARKYGTTVKAIKAANGLKDNNIKAGQKLKIHGKATAAAAGAAPAPTTPSPATVAPTPPPTATLPLSTNPPPPRL